MTAIKNYDFNRTVSFAGLQSPFGRKGRYMVDIDTVKLFLNFLDNSGFYTFSVLNTDTKSVYLGSRYCTIEEILTFFKGVISRNGNTNVTLHVTLNRCKAGRKKADIESVRVLCVDIDKVSTSEHIKTLVSDYECHLVVESSPGKYHLYWKISPAVQLETWSKWQLGLAQAFEGDLNLSQITKTIRVPGIERVLNDGTIWMPRIVFYRGEITELTAEEVLNKFPFIGEAYEAGKKAKKEKAAKQGKAVAEGKAVEAGERNTSLFNYIRGLSGAVKYTLDGLRTPEMALEEALEVGLSANEYFEPPLSQEEAKTCIKSAWEHGLVDRQKKIEEADAVIEKLAEGVDTSTEKIRFDTLDRIEKLAEGVDSATKSTPSLTDLNTGAVSDISADTGAATSTPPNTTVQGTHISPDTPEPRSGPICHAEEGNSAFSSSQEKVFKYDYGNPILKLNRFTDLSLITRVLQKYEGHIVRLDSKNIFVFDKQEKLWKRNAKDVLAEYTANCAYDVLHDPGIVAECSTPSGIISRTKLKALQTRFQSNSILHNSVGTLLIQGNYNKKSLSDFDTSSNLLYCKNGVVDLLTGKIKEAEASDYLLHKTDIPWIPTATCFNFITFLGQVFEEADDRKEMLNFLQQLFGYSLSGSVDAQKLFIHYGAGCNGKSKVLDALYTIGGDYSTRLACNTLSSRKNAVQKELERIGAKIEGKRIVILDDLDVNSQWNEGLVKNITGRVILSRKLYNEEENLVNRSKLHIGCNDAPKPEAENYGILRRLCIIPYMRQFKPDMTKELELQQMIQEEAPGILQWAATGFKEVFTGKGLVYPVSTEIAIEDYETEHFKIESIVKKLFEPPLEETDRYTLDELIETVEKQFRVNISNDVLGRELTRQAYKQERRVINGRKLRLYFVRKSVLLPEDH